MAKASTKQPEVNYEKPASQVDLEARQAEDYVPPGVVGQAVDPQKSENGYVAVDPIYQNYADETHRPGFPEGDENPEAKIWKNFVSEDVDTSIGATAEDEAAGQEKRDSGDVFTADGATLKAPARPTPQESQQAFDEANQSQTPETEGQDQTGAPPSGDTPPAS